MDRGEPGENDVFWPKNLEALKDPGAPRGTPVHPGRAPAGPRFIPVHHGGTTVQPPVLTGPWTGVNRGVPGAQWDWGINDTICIAINVSSKRILIEQLWELTGLGTETKNKLPIDGYH